MKKKFAITAIFLLIYLVFLIATLPATVVLKQITLPKEVLVSGVKGTLWETTIDHITIDKTTIAEVEAKLSFWSLFTLAPQVDVSFGDPLLAGPEGKLSLTVSTDELTITDLNVQVKANEVAQQLILPLPVTAQGDVAVNIKGVSVDIHNNSCLSAAGEAHWSKSGVVALEQNIKLGEFSANIGCEDGVLAVVLSPKNDLGLTFSAYVRQGGKISGTGYLTPGEKFPKALNDALPFLGRKDQQGRYRLSF